MTRDVAIRNIFRLADGMTVLACDRPEVDEVWRERKVVIRTMSGDVQQQIMLVGERIMLGDDANKSLIAIETLEDVELSVDEALSGNWRVAF